MKKLLVVILYISAIVCPGNLFAEKLRLKGYGHVIIEDGKISLTINVYNGSGRRSNSLKVLVWATKVPYQDQIHGWILFEEEFDPLTNKEEIKINEITRDIKSNFPSGFFYITATLYEYKNGTYYCVDKREFGKGDFTRQSEKSKKSNEDDDEDELVPLTIKDCSCSKEYKPEKKCANAVDGNVETEWIAGGFAPQWIKLTLRDSHSISKISWVNNMSPEGQVSMDFSFYNEYGNLVSTKTEAYYGKNGQTNSATFSDLTNIRQIKVTVTKSPSWVSFKEIYVY